MYNIDTAGMSFLDIWNDFNAYAPGPSGPGAPISLLVPQSTATKNTQTNIQITHGEKGFFK